MFNTKKFKFTPMDSVRLLTLISIFIFSFSSWAQNSKDKRDSSSKLEEKLGTEAAESSDGEYEIDFNGRKAPPEEAVKAKSIYEKLLEQKYVLLPHKGNYLIPFSYNDNTNNALYDGVELEQGRGDFVEPLESEFQISFLILVAKDIFGSGFSGFGGYTQKSWWQVYNSSWSKPFRESNYAPEVFVRKTFAKPIRLFGLDILGVDFGYLHQSNGQVQELSRSWNRAYTRATMVRGPFVINAMTWFRIPEKDDDNPDIMDMGGAGKIEVNYFYRKQQFDFAYYPGFEKSGFELGYNLPLGQDLNLYFKANYGYGQSLQDYDIEMRRFGIGFSLANPYSDLTKK